MTPRITRLLRVPDLKAMHAAIAARACPPDPIAARACAVVVPTRGAAEALRRTLERRFLELSGRPAVVMPDLVTRADLYARLHERLPGAPPRLSEFEREVLLRRAARAASDAGAPAPFRLRAGLIVEILAFYDELRRRGKTIADFERLMVDSLESSAEIDRGAERMLRQTRFLVSAYSEFERRVALTGRFDEHALRDRLIAGDAAHAYRRLVIAVPDQAADALGLWAADYDLIARLPGLEEIEIVATENALAAGLHQRLHDALPGMDEARAGDAGPLPALAVPDAGDGPKWFVARDREEELADIVRRVRPSPALDRIAVVFQRPLPYLYLARQVFADAGLPYQALDALPLAAEPFAAAIDVLFTFALAEGTRAAIVDLLGSPHWRFESGGREVRASDVAALDALLRELKFAGGWDRLEQLAAGSAERSAAADRSGAKWRRATVALAAAQAAANRIRAAVDARAASTQIARLLAFIRDHERLPVPDDPYRARHLRARAAILGALQALADAHAQHDDEPLIAGDLTNIVRRWIEGQTFSPRTGWSGVLLLDAPAAGFADVDEMRLVGLVESDWPERSRRSIFYPASLLSQLGWPNEVDRLPAARARFHDLLSLPSRRVSASTFTLEEDALVAASPFLEEMDALPLAVERVPDLPAARGFMHDALMREPPMPGALAGAAREWLDLRVSRSSSTGAEFHGSAGARATSVYAVSHVERYLDCPFKFFAGHVLKLEEERDEAAALTPQERGQFVHEVFQQFFLEWQGRGRRAVTADNVAEALELFGEVAEARLAALPESDRALERTHLLGSAAAPGLAERAFAFEIEDETPVVDRLLEHPLEGEFEFTAAEERRRLRIRAKADRIDLLGDGSLRIVDYKLGRAPKPSRSLQLAVYGVCASQALEQRDGRPWPVSRAGYVAFREKNAFVGLGPANALQQALADGQAKFLAAVAGIERGEFPVDPDEPFMCTRCGYASVCRKDYVGDE